VLRIDRTSLRFTGAQTLGTFLADAGFQIEDQYGDWHRGPTTAISQEIITIARK
jgi:hypothetical protein